MQDAGRGSSGGKRHAWVRDGLVVSELAFACILLVGAGPGLGIAVARRFAAGGYRITLVARSTGSLSDLAGTLASIGAKINTIAADASDPDGLGARMKELYLGNGAPGVIIYNAVMGAPDQLLSSSVATSKRRIQ